jgi:hypothetical protein
MGRQSANSNPVIELPAAIAASRLRIRICPSFDGHHAISRPLKVQMRNILSIEVVEYLLLGAAEYPKRLR